MQPYKQKYKPWRYLQTSRRSAGPMQPYSLKNSSRSTLLLLLRVGRSQKSKWLIFDWLWSSTIAGVYYLYPEPMHESYLSTTHYNLRHKRKHSYLKITWTIIFPFLSSSTCFFSLDANRSFLSLSAGASCREPIPVLHLNQLISTFT